MTPTTLYPLVIALLVGGASASAVAQEEQHRQAFADAMMVCNAHALFQHLYAQGKRVPELPTAADYKALAYQAGGQAYVEARLESRAVRDEAMKQLEAQLNTQPYDGLTEEARERHMTATWSRLLTTCNERAAAGAKSAATPK
ncbi:hypothetical protein [Comamonas serinivorans]|nr:hypothetical protein [Comamonas serinivorans]